MFERREMEGEAFDFYINYFVRFSLPYMTKLLAIYPSLPSPLPLPNSSKKKKKKERKKKMEKMRKKEMMMMMMMVAVVVDNG